MSNNKLSYLNRNFEDYKKSLQEYIAEYYPQIANDFDDASIGSWLIDLVALMGDNLSHYIDRAYSETNIETAQQKSSVYNIARTNGFKIPGPKASMAEVKFTCEIPVADRHVTPNNSSQLGMPAMDYAPVIKRGTKVTSKNQVFEVMDDIDFSSQFNKYGISNREIIPIYDSSKNISAYRLSKTDVVVAGESKIYRQEILPGDVSPFMEIVLPDSNVMNVESVLFKDGANYKADPTMGEFMFNGESFTKDGAQAYRFFEVESLMEQYRWGADTKKEGNQAMPQAVSYEYGYHDFTTDTDKPIVAVTKGEWKPLTQKFITEFTDKGYLKIIFGSGESVGQDSEKYDRATEFSKYQISRMVRNNFLGKLPRAGWTMYVLYRVGGGASSNVPAGAITNISYLNATIGKVSLICDSESRKRVADVKNSISVVNLTPSVSGKDAPSIEEIRAMIKYNNAAQSRCVTVKDYEDRIMMMPPEYGAPFRVSVMEENNKIKIFMLGLNSNGKLSAVFPEMLIRNIMEYLSKFRSVNDFVSIEAGEIIHLKFEVKVFVDKNYNSGDVAYNIIQTVKNYMDINKHQMGEDIFVGDIEKEISSVDGVLNLIDLTVKNMFKEGNSNGKYSSSRIAQAVIEDDSELGEAEILLEDTDYILNSNVDSMFEILDPDSDITVQMIAR